MAQQTDVYSRVLSSSSYDIQILESKHPYNDAFIFNRTVTVSSSLGQPAAIVEIYFDDWSDRIDDPHLEIYCDDVLCFESISNSNSSVPNWPGYRGRSPLIVYDVSMIQVKFQASFCYFSTFTLPCWGYKITLLSTLTGEGWNCTGISQVLAEETVDTSNEAFLSYPHQIINPDYPLSVSRKTEIFKLALHRCSWIGITCNAAYDVISIDLSAYGISGSIPSSLFHITSLTSLYLEHNSFSGTLPETLYKLSNLKILDLSNNYLSGSLSDNIGNRFIVCYTWSLRFF
jgi:hypothetical protein